MTRHAALALLIVLSFTAVAGCDRAPRAPAPAAAATPAAEHAHGPAPAAADLDRPLAELLGAFCEHAVPQHACDECRYELGMVRVAPELFGADGPLDTLVADRRALATVLPVGGEVRPDEERAAWLGPRAAGVVRALRADLGARVARGDPLLELASPEYAAARADFAAARAARALAAATAAREEELFARRVCPEKDLLAARAALAEATARERAATDVLLALGLDAADLARLRDGGGEEGETLLPLRAPFAGTVLAREAAVGAAVAPGERLLLLGDLSRVWVTVSLYERDLAALAAAGEPAGLPAEVRVAAWPERAFAGRLDRLAGVLDETTRTVMARVVVPNPEGLLRPGMFARVDLLLPGGAGEAVALPEEAVLEDEGRTFVFVRATPELFARRPVVPGRAAGGWLEIAGGLRGGETVVARGAFLLKSDVLRAKMGAGCAD